MDETKILDKTKILEDPKSLSSIYSDYKLVGIKRLDDFKETLNITYCQNISFEEAKAKIVKILKGTEEPCEECFDFYHLVDHMGGAFYHPHHDVIFFMHDMKERCIFHEVGHANQCKIWGKDCFTNILEAAGFFPDLHNIIVNENYRPELDPPSALFGDYVKLIYIKDSEKCTHYYRVRYDGKPAKCDIIAVDEAVESKLIDKLTTALATKLKATDPGTFATELATKVATKIVTQPCKEITGAITSTFDNIPDDAKAKIYNYINEKWEEIPLSGGKRAKDIIKQLLLKYCLHVAEELPNPPSTSA